MLVLTEDVVLVQVIRYVMTDDVFNQLATYTR